MKLIIAIVLSILGVAFGIAATILIIYSFVTWFYITIIASILLGLGGVVCSISFRAEILEELE